MNEEKISFIKKGLVSHFPSLAGRIRHTGNCHMFIEDMGNSILPIRGESERFPLFKAEIVGNDIEKARAALKSLARYKHYNDSELICDSINNLAGTVYYFGETYFQINSNLDHNQVLKSINPVNTIKIFSFYLQYVPKKDRKLYRSTIRLGSSKEVFKFSVFESFFPYCRYILTIHLLKLADEVAPRFFMADGFKNNAGLDVKQFNLLRSKFISYITKPYSWKQRSLSNDYMNEYYLVYTSYKNALRKSSDRSKLIDQVNKLLEKMKIDARISVHGIPNESDLKHSLVKLEKGERTFKEALAEIYY